MWTRGAWHLVSARNVRRADLNLHTLANHFAARIDVHLPSALDYDIQVSHNTWQL
jgi:hypothetical protein